jgi:phosphatidate phosphatase APP1
MLRTLFGVKKIPELEVFRGFGSDEQFYVLGRVKEQSPHYNPREGRKAIWQNVTQLVANYLAKPYAQSEVHVHFNGETVIVSTDETGLFEAVFYPVNFTLPDHTEWIDVEVMLVETGEKKDAPVLVEGRGNTYGIISDIDDTILITKATSKLRLMYLTFTRNAHRRQPFRGVSQFYQALIKGSDGKSRNPVMYVSSSHWNLFNVLTHFFKLNDIPIGPLFLKKFSGVRGMIKSVGNHSHKYRAAQKILDTYPDLPFILIGDSGQKDAEIYSQLAIENEGRILAIYIRDVTKSDDVIVEKAIEELDQRVELVVVKTSEEAAVHARSRGYIVENVVLDSHPADTV